IALGVGGSCGAIYSARVEYNLTTDHAIAIRDEVTKLSRNLDSIVGKLRSGQPGKIDVEMAAALGGLDLKKPDTIKIFHTNYAKLEGLMIERLFSYYNDTIQLYDEIASHSKKT